MQNILIKVHNSKQTIAEAVVVTKDGTPTTIKANKKVNYEFIDQATGYAPHHIVTKRVGQDLHISFEENGQESDLIIEGFYEAGDSALIGMAENNQYYYYIPDTGSMADYVTELAIGDIEGQALGGTAYPTPWWIGASDVNAAFVPWLVGLAGIGAAIALGRDKKTTTSTPAIDTTAPEAPTVKATETEVTVTPTGDAVSMTVTYKDRTNQEVTKTFTKDSKGDWVDGDPNDAITIDENTGKVTIPVAVVAEKTPVTATTSKDNAGNPSEKGEATTLDIPPSAPTVTAENTGDGKIDLPKDLEAGDKVTVTVPLKDGTTATVTLTKQPDGTLTSDKPAIIPNVPAGQTSITIPATELKDGGTLTATSTTADGKVGGKGEVVVKDTVPEPTISANADGISITPEDRKYPTPDSPSSIDGKYVNANGDTVTFGFAKDPNTGDWVDNNPNDAITIDPKTGVVNIPSSELKPGSPAEATQSFGNDTSSPATVQVLSASFAPKPNVDAQPDGSVTIEKTADNATELTASYKDETGADKTVTAVKDPATGKWVQDPSKPVNDKVSVDETTGKITIPANEVKDGSLVTGTQAVPNAPQKGEDTAVVNNETDTLPVAPSPVVTDNNDGSVSVAPTTNDTPSKNATSATATYTDEAGNPQTVTVSKNPTTGKWEKDPANTNDKVTVNPDTGVITIPADEVKDGSEVKGTQSTPIGDGVATSIAKDNIPEPTVKANDDGSATITPTKDATSLTVEFNDENNTLNTIKAEKQGDKWVITDPSNNPNIKINETTGEISIPADKLKDGSEVVANQITPQGISGDATDRVKAFDNADKPTITVTPPTSQDNDGDITAKPGDDNTKVTVTFTDEDGKPQTITTQKGDHDNDPSTPDTWAVDPTKTTVPVSTTPTTDGKTPYIDPTTGDVTLPKDSVDNDKPVTVTGEKEGSTPAVETTNPTDKPTVDDTKRDPADNDGDITAKPGDDNTKVTVTFTDEDGKPQTITTQKGDHDNDPSTPDTWAVDPTKTTVPVSTTPTTDGKTPYIDPTTGDVTLPKDSVDNDKPVTVTGEKEGSTPAVETTNPTDKPTVDDTKRDPADNDGDITAKPGDDNTKVTVTFTDEDGKPQTITTQKGDHDNDPSTPDTWAVDPTKTTVPVSTTPTTDGKTPYIDPTTGDVTLPKDSVDNDKPVTVTGEKEGSTPAVETTNPTDKPTVDDTKRDPADNDGDITAKPGDDNTKVTVTFTDEDGKPQTITTQKGDHDNDPSTPDTWAVDPTKTTVPVSTTPTTDGKTPYIDPTTGDVTLPKDSVDNDKPVTVTGEKEGSTPAVETTNPTDKPTVDDTKRDPADNDGDITAKPGDDNTKVTVTFTDEDGKPQTITTQKGDHDNDPSTPDTWAVDPTKTTVPVSTTPTTDGKTPYIDPTTGDVTLPKDSVDNDKPVTVTGEKEGSTPAVETTNPTDKPTVDDTKRDPADNDGDITAKPGDDNTKVTVTFTDEDGKPQTITTQKGDHDNDPSTPDTWAVDPTKTTVPVSTTPTTDGKTPYIDPTTGDVTLPKDSVDNDKPVTVTGEKEGSTPAVETTNPTDKPTVDDTKRDPADNDGDITAKPGDDNTKVTVTFTDEDGKPQTITTQKGDHDNDPSTPDTWAVDPTKTTVPVSTTPTTDGKTPYIDPTTGDVTLPKDSVDNDKPVTVTGEKEGSTPAVETTNPTPPPADTTAPTLTKSEVPATGDKIELTFNEPLDPNNPPVVTDFTVTVDGKPVNPTDVKVEGDKVTLTLPTPAKQGEPVTVAYTDPTTGNDTNAIQDKSGNDAANIPTTPVTNNSTVPTPPPADTTAPTLTKSEVPATGDKIELTFNEPLDPNNPPVVTDFTVTVDGKPVNPTDVKVEGDKVTLTLPTPAKQGEPVTVAYTDPTTGNDTNAIQDKSGNDAANIPTTPVTNNSTVPTPPPADTTAPTLTKSEVPATGDKIELTFNEPLDPNNPPVVTDFTVTVDGKPVNPTDVKVEGDKVTLTLPTPAKQGEPVTVAYTDPTTGNDTNAIQDKSGNDAANIPTTPVTNNSTVPTPPPADTTAPTLTKSEVPATGDKIELTFNEPLDPNNPPVVTDFTVTVDGKPVNPTDVKVEGDKVTLTLPTPAKQGEPVTVAYTDPTTGNDTNAIQDKSGNDAANIPTTPVTNNSTVPTPPPADTTAPTLTKSEVPATGDKIELTFNEPLDPNNPPVVTDFTVTVDGKPVNPTDVKVEGDKVTLTLPTPAKQGEPVTVAYTDPTTGNDTNAIQDKSGNDAANIPTTPVTNNSTVPTPPPADTTAPTLTKSEVPATGDKIELTFNEPLDPNNPPVVTDFTVTVDGKPVNPTDVKVEGDKVTLTLPTPAKQGEPVTVAYTDPTTGNDTNAIQDKSGNDAANIPTTPVTNNSTVPTPPPAPTPVAGASSTVKMVIGTNDVIFKDTVVKFNGIQDSSRTRGTTVVTQSIEDTESSLTWGASTGGRSSIKVAAASASGSDVGDLGIAAAVATLTHTNASISPESNVLTKTGLVMSTTVEINGKPVSISNIDFGSIYAHEASGTRPDYFVFVPKNHNVTIDGKNYTISLKDVTVTGSPQNLEQNKQEFTALLQSNPQSQQFASDLRQNGASVLTDAIVIASAEGATTNFNLNFKIDPVSGQTNPLPKATDPAPITGNIGGTGNWTAGTGHTGVTVESAGANTFNVKKGEVIMGKLVGQANGAYSFDPTIEGAQAIKNGEKLVANFKHGTSDLSLELNGMYVADANKLSNDDKVDSVYVSKTADVSLSSLLDVKADMIDLTGSANSLQDVTLTNVRTFTQNSGSPLYIRGDVGDKVTLGDVLASGATTQADGTTTWTKGEVKTGSTIDGDTTTKYDTWTNGTVNLYIDQDITVL